MVDHPEHGEERQPIGQTHGGEPAGEDRLERVARARGPAPTRARARSRGAPGRRPTCGRGAPSMCATQARTSVAQLGRRRRPPSPRSRPRARAAAPSAARRSAAAAAAWSRCSGRARRSAARSPRSARPSRWPGSRGARTARRRWRRPPAGGGRSARGARERSVASSTFVTGVRYKYRMDFDLPDDHELIRRTVRDFAEQEVAPVAEELDRTKAFPYAIVKQLGELGLMGIPFPEEYGGGGGRLAGLRDRGRGAHARGLVAWRSRCARTRRSARSRSTCSAPRSRSRSGCRS